MICQKCGREIPANWYPVCLHGKPYPKPPVVRKVCGEHHPTYDSTICYLDPGHEGPHEYAVVVGANQAG